MLIKDKWWIGLLIAVLVGAGCSPGPIPSPTIDEDCTAQAESLRYQVEELERHTAELEAWADQLAEGFGPGVWYFNPNGTSYPLFHHAPADPSLEGIAGELNSLLSEEAAPQIILGGKAGTTVRVQLTDDAALTQRMGSAGAQAYLQVVLYSLTSLPGIDCVEFDFVEGDHAQPGLYCR